MCFPIFDEKNCNFAHPALIILNPSCYLSMSIYAGNINGKKPSQTSKRISHHTNITLWLLILLRAFQLSQIRISTGTNCLLDNVISWYFNYYARFTNRIIRLRGSSRLMFTTAGPLFHCIYSLLSIYVSRLFSVNVEKTNYWNN